MTFAVAQLIDRLNYWERSSFNQWLDAYSHLDAAVLRKDTKNKLDLLLQALPIIQAIEERGAHHLVDIIQDSNKATLSALSHLIPDTDWRPLFELFLANPELDLARRSYLIDFLRPDNSSKHVSNLLAYFNEQASYCLSLYLLLDMSSVPLNHENQFLALLAFLKHYPFSVQEQVLWTWALMHQGHLQGRTPWVDSFILVLDRLFNQLEPSAYHSALKGMDTVYLNMLIEYCLYQHSHLSNNNNQSLYQRVLFFICSNLSLLDDAFIHKTRETLYLEDEFIFDKLVQDIALSGSAYIKTLQLRYHAFILSHPQDKIAELILSAGTANPFRFLINSRLRLLQAQLEAAPNERRLLRQRDQLIDWSIERCFPLLLNNLAHYCSETLQNTQAECVTSHLFRYYTERSNNLRVDVLLRAIEYSYPNVQDLQEGSPFHQVLGGWFHQYLKADDWLRLQQTHLDDYALLYNEGGVATAFIDERNQVWSYIDEQPVIVTSKGLSPLDNIFYDKKADPFGSVSESGYFHALGIQKNFSALLLASVPCADLEYSLSSLDLLINHLLFENTVALLYASIEQQTEEGRSKWGWIEQHISRILVGKDTSCSIEVMHAVVTFFNEDALLSLMCQIKNKAQALGFFAAVLAYEPVRSKFFAQMHHSKFAPFLHQHAPDSLSHYLGSHHQPWFVDGLLGFARYNKKYRKNAKEFLLCQALNIISEHGAGHSDQPDSINTIIIKLFSRRHSAYIIYHHFLGVDKAIPFHELYAPGLDQFVQYCSKAHALELIRQIKTEGFSADDPRCNLVFSILFKQQERLFCSKIEMQSNLDWSADDINSLAFFAGSCMRFKIDINFSAYLLGELLFYSARLGQSALFYQADLLNISIAHHVFHPSALSSLVKKFGNFGFKKQDLELSRVPRISPLLAIISPPPSRAEIESQRRRSALSVYLLNYIGPSKTVFSLLTDCFKHCTHQKSLIRSVTHLLSCIPKREISAVIFDSLLVELKVRPGLLDVCILKDMASYWAIRTNALIRDKLDAEFNLVYYWGQSRMYALTEQAYVVLAREYFYFNRYEQFHRCAKEARVEGEIENMRPLFGSFGRWCKRFWNYGLHPQKHCSGLVSFFDPKMPAPDLIQCAPAFVAAPFVRQENSACEGSSREKVAFINLLRSINRSTFVIESRPSQVQAFSLFNHQGSARGRIEDQLAGQDVELTV